MKNILFGSVVAAALVLSGCGSSSSSSTPETNTTKKDTTKKDTTKKDTTKKDTPEKDTPVAEVDLNLTVSEVTINTKTYLDRNDINMTDIYGTTRTYAFAKDYCKKLDGDKWALPTLTDLNETLVTGITVNNDGDEGSFDSLAAGVFPNNINTSFIWVGSSDATNPIILNLSDKSKQDKTNIGTNNDVTSKGLFTCVKK